MHYTLRGTLRFATAARLARGVACYAAEPSRGAAAVGALTRRKTVLFVDVQREGDAATFEAALRAVSAAAMFASMGSVEGRFEGSPPAAARVDAGGRISRRFRLDHPRLDRVLGSHRFRLEQHLTLIDVAPDGSRAAVAGEGRAVTLLDLTTGEVETHLLGHHQYVVEGRFGPDGQTLYTTEPEPERLIRWDLATGAYKVRGVTSVRVLAPSPDGALLAIGGEENEEGGYVHILDAASLKEVAALTRQTECVTSLAFSPDGKTLVSGTAEGALRRWEVGTWKDEGEVLAEPLCLTEPAFVPGSRTIVVSAATEPHLRAIDLDTGAVVRAANPALGYDRMAVSADGARVAMVALIPGRRADEAVVKRVAVFDLAGDTPTLWMDGDRAPRFLPGDREVAYPGRYQALRVLDASTGAPRAGTDGHQHRVQGVAFSPDGRALASCGDHDNTLRVWDLATGAELARVDVPSTRFHEAHWGERFLAVRTAVDETAGAVVLYRSGALDEVRRLAAHPSSQGGLAVSGDGRRLARRAPDGTLAVVDLATFDEVRRFDLRATSQCEFLTALALSPDGRHLAAAFEDGTVLRWAVEGDDGARALAGHRQAVWGLCYVGDALLASACAQGFVRLWDAATGAARTTLAVGSTVSALSPVGGGLAAALPDRQQVVVWRDPAKVTDAPEVFEGHAACSLAASPDGGRLAVGGYDTTIAVWKVGAGA